MDRYIVIRTFHVEFRVETAVTMVSDTSKCEIESVTYLDLLTLLDNYMRVNSRSSNLYDIRTLIY